MRVNTFASVAWRVDEHGFDWVTGTLQKTIDGTTYLHSGSHRFEVQPVAATAAAREVASLAPGVYLESVVGGAIDDDPHELIEATQVLPGARDLPEEPLQYKEWACARNLTVHVATTKHLQVTWRIPTRKPGWRTVHARDLLFDFYPDRDGWITHDFTTWRTGPYTIDDPSKDDWVADDSCYDTGRSARVSWNLHTNAVRVESLDGSPIDRKKADVVTRFAKNTLFPGIDLGTLVYTGATAGVTPTTSLSTEWYERLRRVFPFLRGPS